MTSRASSMPVLRHLNRWTIAALGVLLVVATAFAITLAVRFGSETPAAAAAASYQSLRDDLETTSADLASRVDELTAAIETNAALHDDLRAASSATASGADAAALETLIAEFDAFDATLSATTDALPEARPFTAPVLAEDADLGEIGAAVDAVSAERALLDLDLTAVLTLEADLRTARAKLSAAVSSFGSTLPTTAQAIAAAAPAELTQDWRDSLVASAAVAATGTAAMSTAASALEQYATTVSSFSGEVARVIAVADEGTFGGGESSGGGAPAPEEPAPVEPTTPDPEPEPDPVIP